MIGLIERIKNNVLLKCSTLNDSIISSELIRLIDEGIYHFAEDLISIINDLHMNISEESIRYKADEILKVPIVKKIKRKLFIDSLALQITNDSFVEKCVKEECSIKDVRKNYIKELNNNKTSNQLNMTENLKLNEIFSDLRTFIDNDIVTKVIENIFIVNAITALVNNTEADFEQKLEVMINEADRKYLDILINELEENLNEEIVETKVEEEKGDDDIMLENINISVEETQEEQINENIAKFEQYDDMTLFNKMLLSLNTREEKLTRNEKKIEKRKLEVEEILSATNRNIEANVEREGRLSERKLELNAREIELNSKLSEAEVIFLNMKPLIKGLNKIKESELKGDSNNE